MFSYKHWICSGSMFWLCTCCSSVDGFAQEIGFRYRICIVVKWKRFCI